MTRHDVFGPLLGIVCCLLIAGTTACVTHPPTRVARIAGGPAGRGLVHPVTGREARQLPYLWQPCPGDLIEVPALDGSRFCTRLRLLRVGGTDRPGVLVFEDQPIRRDGTFGPLAATRIISEDEARRRVDTGQWRLKYKGVPEEARPFSYGRLVEG